MTLRYQLEKCKKKHSYEQSNTFGCLSGCLPLLYVAYDLISNDRPVHTKANKEQSLDKDDDKVS